MDDSSDLDGSCSSHKGTIYKFKYPLASHAQVKGDLDSKLNLPCNARNRTQTPQMAEVEEYRWVRNRIIR